MIDFLEVEKKKLNGLIWHLVSTGTVLLFLAILIVWTDFMVRLAAGLFVIVISYTFFYLGYRVWSFKKALEKHFKI